MRTTDLMVYPPWLAGLVLASEAGSVRGSSYPRPFATHVAKVSGSQSFGLAFESHVGQPTVARGKIEEAGLWASRLGHAWLAWKAGRRLGMWVRGGSAEQAARLARTALRDFGFCLPVHFAAEDDELVVLHWIPPEWLNLHPGWNMPREALRLAVPALARRQMQFGLVGADSLALVAS